MSEENAQVADTEVATTAEAAQPMAVEAPAAANNPAPAAAVAAPVINEAPTPEQARALFAERPDMAAVLTPEGWLRRDGTLS